MGVAPDATYATVPTPSLDKGDVFSSNFMNAWSDPVLSALQLIVGLGA